MITISGWLGFKLVVLAFMLGLLLAAAFSDWDDWRNP